MRKFIKFMKNSLIGKILKTLFKLAWRALEIFLVLLAITILVPRITNNEYSFFGYRIFTVVTGSMEPEYVVGNVLIAKETDPEEIVVGTNIVYQGRVGDYKNRIITHQVVRREQDEKGNYLFYTKGIANTVEDPVVYEDQLYGKIINNNIFLAFWCRLLTNKYGLFLVIVLIAISLFSGFVKSQGEKREEELEEKRQRRAEATRPRKTGAEVARTRRTNSEETRPKIEMPEETKTRRKGTNDEENSLENEEEANIEVEPKKVKKTKKEETEIDPIIEIEKNSESIEETPKKPKKKSETVEETPKKPKRKSETTQETSEKPKKI